MRLFIAVDVPEELKHNIAMVQERFSDFKNIRKSPKETLHYTLKFIGETDKDPEELQQRLERAVKDFSKFNIETKNMGVFPHEEHIRVIWVGGENLLNLQKAVMEEFSDIGDSKERKLNPHMTIARVKSGESKEEIMKHINQLKEHSFGTLQVGSIKIKSSTLTGDGPTYENIATVELN